MSPGPGRDDDRKGIERELKRGSLELIVLHLLSLGEAYGYEIVTTLTERTNGGLEVTDGTLYPVLYRLERAGFVAVRWETPQRGVPRKYYRLTEAGHAELASLTTGVEHVCQRDGTASSPATGDNMNADQSYIDQVVAQLPRDARLREQVAMELRSHIAERVEHGQTVEEALRHLGDPVVLAESYLAAIPLIPASFWPRAAARLLDFFGVVTLAVPVACVLFLRCGQKSRSSFSWSWSALC